MEITEMEKIDYKQEKCKLNMEEKDWKALK